MSRRRNRHGLTKGEILLIVALFAAALALLVPYIYRQRLMQRRLWCESRQIEIAKAILRYDQTNGHFPGYRNLQAETAAGERVATGWVFPVLPFLGRINEPPDSRPYQDFHREHGPSGPEGTRGLIPRKFLPELVCPANAPQDRQAKPNWLAWVVNSGLPDVPSDDGLPPDWPANGVFLDRFVQPQDPGNAVSLAYISEHDGSENTLLVSENVDAGQWTDDAEPRVAFVWVANLVNGEPNPGGVLFRINRKRGAGDGSLQFARPSSNHRGGVNAIFCDGSSRFLNEDIDYLVFCRLMTPDGAQVKEAGSAEPIGPPFRDPK